MARFDLKDLKLDDLVGDLKGSLRDRADDLLGEGQTRARRAVGGHDDSAMFGTFAIGMVIGALVGAAIALLITPVSGEDARKKLSERVERARASDQTPAWETSGSTADGNGRASHQSPMSRG